MIFDEDKCMNNTYFLVTGRRTVKDFLDEEGDLYFLHNPNDLTYFCNNDVYDQLIEYFTETEEYEKCGEILELKNISKEIVLN
jgi:hypothetical protein|tara:strand:- start:1501 stop:1749 length:249 start_codon:yes stop_codon:yes gene_type:complete